MTPDEIEELRKAAAGQDPRDVARRLGRPVKGLLSKSHTEGIPFRRKWSEAEYQALRDGHAQGRQLTDIADELGRGYAAVAKMASHMGLGFKREARPPANGKPAPVRVSLAQAVQFLEYQGHYVVEMAKGTFIVDGRASYDPYGLALRVNRMRKERSESPFVVVDLPEPRS